MYCVGIMYLLNCNTCKYRLNTYYNTYSPNAQTQYILQYIIHTCIQTQYILQCIQMLSIWIQSLATSQVTTVFQLVAVFRIVDHLRSCGWTCCRHCAARAATDSSPPCCWLTRSSTTGQYCLPGHLEGTTLKLW